MAEQGSSSGGRSRSVLAALALAMALAGMPGSAAGAGPDGDGDRLTDAFELAYGFDPARRDTDGDGLQDTVENEDGDGLGALGEQRAGTSPLLADTDSDGRRDDREDADGDGVDNAHEQDRRPLPLPIMPRLSRIADAEPAYYGLGCHSEDARVRTCEFGDPTSATTIVLFGDSHIGQWEPALERAAKEWGWRLITLTKSACPVADIRTPRWDVPPTCGGWRDAAIAWLEAHPPTLLVVGSSHLYHRLDRRGRRIPRDQTTDQWAAAMKAGLLRLPAGVPVVLIADTTRRLSDSATCLRGHRGNVGPCSTPRAWALYPQLREPELAAARDAGVPVADFTDLVCPYGPCPALDGSIVIHRDNTHITAQFSAAVWRPVATVVAGYLPAPPGASARHRTRGPARQGRERERAP